MNKKELKGGGEFWFSVSFTLPSNTNKDDKFTIHFDIPDKYFIDNTPHHWTQASFNYDANKNYPDGWFGVLGPLKIKDEKLATASQETAGARIFVANRVEKHIIQTTPPRERPS